MEKGLYINPTTFVPLNQIKEGLTAEIATRQFAMGGYSGFFNLLPDPDPILRKLGQDQTVYKDLLSDDQVGPLFNRRKNLTKSQDWFIQQNDAGDKEVDLCEKTLAVLEANGCKTKDIISQSLNPVGFGYGVYEIIYGYVDGNWLPVRVWEKPREWFHFDGKNQLRFKTKENFEGVVIIGEEADPKYSMKFILIQNDPTYENPYGDKALSRCFWPVNFKRGGIKFYSIFIEKYGMPYLFGKLPRGAKHEEHADLLTKLTNMVQDAVGTGPDDSSLELIEMKGTRSGDLYEKYLLRCDNAISKAILGNALSTEIQTTGARAATETGAETIEGDIAQTDQDFPAALFNEIFKRVIDLNIGSGLYPTFGTKEIEDAKTDFATRDKTLSETVSAAGQKIKFKKEYFVNNYNYNPDEFEIIEDSPPPQNNSLPLPGAGHGLSAGASAQAGVGLINPETGEPITKTELSSWKKFWNKILRRNIELQEAAPLALTDQLVNAIPEKLLQFQMEEVLKPVIELAKNSTSRDEFISGLAKLYPDMNTTEVEELVTKVLFISQIEGRLNA